jgi:hypothetical protein
MGTSAEVVVLAEEALLDEDGLEVVHGHVPFVGQVLLQVVGHPLGPLLQVPRSRPAIIFFFSRPLVQEAIPSAKFVVRVLQEGVAVGVLLDLSRVPPRSLERPS